MKDFLKILFILVIIVIAFVTGRNYGENSILESKEYKETKSKIADNATSNEELTLMKEKIQSLLESSDLKKADEVYGKMMTLFLVDLGLRISEQQQKDLDVGKSQLLICAAQSGQKPAIKTAAEPIHPPLPAPREELQEPRAPKFSQIAPGRFKSTEWTLVNSSSNSEILRNLEKVKLSSIDAFIIDSPETKFSDLQKFYGTFRGRISAVDGSNYGSLVITVGANQEKENNVAGTVELFRQGKVESSQNFRGTSWGKTPAGYQGNMVEMGNRFLQIYKIETADKIAGNFYEKLPAGTTKLIGSFVLNRTDRF